ncbi:MAG: hypothetical protein IRZ28_02945 [Steroidobacteraceae bacterium]|nr:hypothetical protein [Steroidobacteraceae bacterium]
MQARYGVSAVDVVQQPRMTDGFKLALAWIGASLTALIVALAPLSASLFQGRYVPIGPDSFYHARRILDAVADPSSFFQFDPHMHVPEGSLVIWPWAYDYVVSLITRAAIALHLSDDPMAVLVHLPVLVFPLAIALVLVVCRALRLSVTATLLALLATAFFPLNQTLYGIGNIDHHFAEHLFVLGSLAAGLVWLRKPESAARALTTGVVLAMAPGVHPGLFVLQIPLLATFAILWLRRAPLPDTTRPFAIALIIGTACIAAPSLALRQGHFEYYTLSWFQVYIAACTGVLCVLLSRLPRSPGHAAVIAGTAAAMIAPIIGQILLARDFFTVSVEGMDQISEVQSVWLLWTRSGSIGYVAGMYTHLVLLLPATVLLCAWRLWRDREPSFILFWSACLLGLPMLLMQLRLQYFGSFALYVPWLVLLDGWAREHSVGRMKVKPSHVHAFTALALGLAYAYPVNARLFESHVVAGDPNYAVTSPLYAPLARACERNPGVVLANPDDGHYIRFHTRCDVIGNNFLLTRQHAEKVAFEHELLSLKAVDVPRRAPYVRYVYVRRDSMFFSTPEGTLEFAPGDYAALPDLPLVRELLNADATNLPAGYTLMYELRLNDAAGAPYARLYSIDATHKDP